MSKKSSEQQIARALQAKHGISYQAALNLVHRELARLKLDGVPLKAARERVAVMTREELGIRRAG